MKIAHMAEGFGLDVEYHARGRHSATASPRRATATTTKWRSSTRSVRIRSRRCTRTTTRTCWTPSTQTAACVQVPDGPGLGVEYDWDEIEAREIGRRTYE